MGSGASERQLNLVLRQQWRLGLVIDARVVYRGERRGLWEEAILGAEDRYGRPQAVDAIEVPLTSRRSDPRAYRLDWLSPDDATRDANDEGAPRVKPRT